MQEAQAKVIELIQEFNDCLNRQEIAGMLARMTEDVVFENTFPPPDGTRYEGQAAVKAFWQEFFQSSPNAHIAFEEIFATNDRCVVRWRYTWDVQAGKQGYIRGIDLFKIRDGKIAEKLSYVKG